MSLTNIKRWIKFLAEGSSCKFEEVQSEADNYTFYKATDSSYDRFLVVMDLEYILSPQKINESVSLATPQELKMLPPFSKNTDVIVLFQLSSLTELPSLEFDMFSIEEDSYSFKKHFLYYTAGEQTILSNISEHDVDVVLSDREKFEKYKLNQFEESEYGIISRLFIKLPFLPVPVDKSDLDDPCDIADNLLSQGEVSELHQSIKKLLSESGNSYKSTIEELINAKMAPQPSED